MYLTWRPGWPHLRSERVRGPLGYLLPWPLRQTLSQNIPLMISSSQSGRVSTLFRGGEDVKGRQHLLLCCLVELSAPRSSTPAFERTHSLTSSRDDWATHPTNPAGGCCRGCHSVGGGEGLESARRQRAGLAPARACLAGLPISHWNSSRLRGGGGSWDSWERDSERRPGSGSGQLSLSYSLNLISESPCPGRQRRGGRASEQKLNENSTPLSACPKGNDDNLRNAILVLVCKALGLDITTIPIHNRWVEFIWIYRRIWI